MALCQVLVARAQASLAFFSQVTCSPGWLCVFITLLWDAQCGGGQLGSAMQYWWEPLGAFCRGLCVVISEWQLLKVLCCGNSNPHSENLLLNCERLFI